MIDTVLFDLDATLVDDGPNWRRSVNETIELVCSRHGDADAEAVREKYYAAAGSVWEEIRSAETAPWGNMDDEGIVTKVWKKTLAQMLVENTDTLQQAVSKYLGLRSSGAGRRARCSG